MLNLSLVDISLLLKHAAYTVQCGVRNQTQDTAGSVHKTKGTLYKFFNKGYKNKPDKSREVVGAESK